MARQKAYRSSCMAVCHSIQQNLRISSTEMKFFVHSQKPTIMTYVIICSKNYISQYRATTSKYLARVRRRTRASGTSNAKRSDQLRGSTQRGPTVRLSFSFSCVSRVSPRQVQAKAESFRSRQNVMQNGRWIKSPQAQNQRAMRVQNFFEIRENKTKG